jgi:tetratricopeptide (TPR) repeat protein
VVKFIPRDSPDRPACLSNLSEAFRRRFERFGDKNDLKEGISSLCDAVGSTPHNSPDYPGRLNNLGILYSSRFERFGDITDINEAISCESDAVEATPSDSPDRPVFLSNLGEARRRRFKRLGHENDIKEGITSLCDAVKVTPHDSPDYPGRLNNLAILYSSRFERFGDISDIDEAISNVRGALEVLPHDSPARPVCLSNLGEALHRRFVRFGDAKDINTAIVCLREAVELTPQDNPGYPSRINNLGILFSSRFERFGDVNDIAEAISRGSIAIEFTPHDSPDRPSRLNSRGASFWYRFKQFGDKSDIDTAIASMLEAVNGTPDNSPDLPSHLNNLGFLYSKRFGLLAVVKDIDDAIEMQRKAVELTPPDSPTISAHLNNLGDSLLLRNSTTQDFKEAMSVYSLSSKSSNGYPSDRFLASSKLANRLYAADDCSAAYEGYVLAISVLPQIAWIGLDVVSQLEQLSSFISTLPCDAAACAFKLAEQEPHLTQEHLEHAIQFLDHGRSILLTQAANFRSDMKELKNQAPKLAEELEIVGRALIQGSFRDLRENIVSEEAHRRSVKKFEQLLCDARQLHGFEDFLRPPPIAKLRLTAAHGPVIIINISTYRCDALIIRPHADETVHMPLSAANMTEVNKLAGELAEAVAAFENGDELYVDPVVLKRALNKIWTCLGWPIIVKLEALGELHLGSLRRVWWCVTGMLTFLPIHASFPQLNPRKRSPAPGMMDRVISSYTPTLSALYRAQRQQPLPVLMLAVCDPSLPSAEFEMDVIGRHLSSHEVVFLKGPEMTSVRVLDLLKECTWAHFACHGIQDKDQPMNSALSMHDRNLTLSRIAQDSLCHAECAFLSACQSAQVSSRVADESLHLAAGLQSAGFRSVVGTMWSIKDMNGSIVADKFYDQVFRNGADHAAASDTALALHLALRHLRDIAQVPLAQWVPFIHLGV